MNQQPQRANNATMSTLLPVNPLLASLLIGLPFVFPFSSGVDGTPGMMLDYLFFKTSTTDAASLSHATAVSFENRHGFPGVPFRFLLFLRMNKL